MRPQASRDDGGFTTPIELMYLLAVVLVSIVFLGWLGRLASAGVQVTNTAQDAARSASLTDDADLARTAVTATVAHSALGQRCQTGPVTTMTWKPSPLGTWAGGSVTVLVTCTVTNESLTGLWSPGSHTVRVADTQVIERFRR